MKCSFSLDYNYPILSSNDIFDQTNLLLKNILEKNITSSNPKVAIFIDKSINDLYPNLSQKIDHYFNQTKLNLIKSFFHLHAGEDSKNDPQLLTDAYNYIKKYKIDRHSFILCIGGGAANDFSGFVCSSAHRGIKLIRIPTTVLSQNDAAIGVKNAINFEGSKNFIGNFHTPLAVINDSLFLRTLDHATFISGYAESVKIGLIKDEYFFEWIERNLNALNTKNEEEVNYLIAKTADLHIDHFSNSNDPFERGSSRPLDFGHWFAHKLESLSNFNILHGEAVAIGLYLDSLYSLKTNSLSESEFKRISHVLKSLDLLSKKNFLKEIKSIKEHLESALEEFREHLGGDLSIPILVKIGSFYNVNKLDLELYLECIEELLWEDLLVHKKNTKQDSSHFLY